MKKIFLFIIAIVLLLGGCRKDADELSGGDTKIIILSGNNQYDTVGHMLDNEIQLGISNPKFDLYKYNFKVYRNDCDWREYEFITMKWDSTFRFYWNLECQPGKQSFRVELLDSLLEVIDISTLEMTAIPAGTGWQPSCCINTNAIHDMEVLENGKIIAGMFYPYYSEDDGIKWEKFFTYPTYNTRQVAVTPDDEIFIGNYDGSVYYSNDNGLTWERRNEGLAPKGIITGLEYTRNNKLIAATHNSKLFLSVDKGITWKSISNGLDINDSFYYISENSKEEFFVVSTDGEVYKSIDQGTTWKKLTFDITSYVTSMFIDQNNVIYIGTRDESAELYKSLDNGTTWTKIYTAKEIPSTYTTISLIKKVDERLFFNIGASGLFSTIDEVNYTNLTEGYFEHVEKYAITKTGKVVLKISNIGMHYWND